MNNDNGMLDALINSAAAASGSSRAQLEQAINGDARIKAAVSRLSPEDISKLQAVLSDPERTRKLLSSPQAQMLMHRLRKNSGSGK